MRQIEITEHSIIDGERIGEDYIAEQYCFGERVDHNSTYEPFDIVYTQHYYIYSTLAGPLTVIEERE